MIRRPPISTRTDTLCPYTTLCRSDDVERQAVEQVLTKLAGTRHRRKIDVGGTDQTNIDLDRFTGTDSLELAVFNDTQQLLLQPQRHGRQLIEKDRDLVGKRSEERRVGKECVRTFRTRWTQ